MRRHPSIPLVFVVLTLTAVLAACGGSTSDGDAAAGQDGDTSARAAAAATLAALPAVPSAGCGSSTAGASELVRREVGITDPETGEARWYLLSTPSAHDGTTPVPLVVDFHGLSEGASIHAAHSDLTPFAEANGFVAAFPNGTGTPVRWNLNDAATDLAYVDAVLEQLETERCIDTARVYATGLSNGAGMTSLVGCVRADRFAAIAPVAGLNPPQQCEGVSTPVVGFHGTVDPILFYNGGVGNLIGLMSGTAEAEVPPAVLDGDGYPSNARSWAAQNGCDPEPAKTRITPAVEHWVFDCPAGADVEFYAIEGGGHTWPGSQFSVNIAAIAGPTTFDISANEVMWDFFERHARAG
jgi:polyhydroxybutyrate depolymerase